MDLTFELKIRPKLKDHILKLEGVFSWVGLPNFGRKMNFNYSRFMFFTSWTLDPSVNALGPKGNINQKDWSILEFLSVLDPRYLV